MRKLFYIVSIMVVFSLSSCAANTSSDTKTEEAMLNEIIQYFEETDNRSFEISYPVNIENAEYYRITVYGILNNGDRYPIDVFAISPKNYDRYFYNSNTNQFQRFYNYPTYACKTSPDKKMRIESIGMGTDGPSGAHALREMRIINLSTGNIEWNGKSYLWNRFMWSDDSRFVAVQFSGRQWTTTNAIDTNNYCIINLPGLNDVLELIPDATELNEYAPIPLFTITEWENSTIIIGFKWGTNICTEVIGTYKYDIINDTIDIIEIDEVQSG